MNIIICGAGRVGFTIAKLLTEQDHSITVIDQSLGKAVMSFVNGKMIMKDGKSVSQGGNWLFLAEGEKIAKNSGIPYEIIDLSLSKLYR